MPDMCPFEKKEKDFFLDYQLFFQEQKKIFQRTTFVQFFMNYNAKKNFGAIQKNFF